MTSFLIESTLDVIFETLGAFGGIFLSFSIFRIPYLSYLKETILISFILSIVGFISFDFIHIPIYYKEIIVFVLSFILHLVFIKLTPWHAFLIALSGYIISRLLLLSFALISFSLGLVTANQAMDIEAFLFIYQFLTFAAAVGIGLFLYHKRIGFVFISDKMNFNPALKKVNTLIISSLILGILSIQLTIYAIVAKMHFSYVIAIGLLIIFDIFLWTVYTRLKKEHEIHHNQMNTKKLFN